MDNNVRLLHRHKPPRPDRAPRRRGVKLARDRIGEAVEGDRSGLAGAEVDLAVAPLAGSGDSVGDVGAAEGGGNHVLSGGFVLGLCSAVFS